MPEPEILSEIEKAIKTPHLYSSGEPKNRLRAAFDALVSQSFTDIFGEEPRSRMNARQQLNAAKKENYPAHWRAIVALREALRVSEHTLHLREYEDLKPKIEGFIKNQLGKLFEAVK